MVMGYTNLEKIFENLEKNALSIARKMYNYNLDDDLHIFDIYVDKIGQKLTIWLNVADPRPGRFPRACWAAEGEVFVDAEGNETYRIRISSSNTLNTEEYYPCSQTLADMMHEIEDRRLKFIRNGYITLCNTATEQVIDSLS